MYELLRMNDTELNLKFTFSRNNRNKQESAHQSNQHNDFARSLFIIIM